LTGRSPGYAGSESYAAFTIVGWAIVCAVAFLLCIVSALISGTGIVALLSNPWRGLLPYAVGGSLYGLVQCSFLDLGIRRSFWWVAVTAVGWALGATIGALLGEPIAATLFPDSGYSGIIMGPRDFAFMLAHGSIGVAVYSIITALPIALLLSRRAES
jgi:hypothetical protein